MFLLGDRFIDALLFSLISYSPYLLSVLLLAGMSLTVWRRSGRAGLLLLLSALALGLAFLLLTVAQPLFQQWAARRFYEFEKLRLILTASGFVLSAFVCLPLILAAFAALSIPKKNQQAGP